MKNKKNISKNNYIYRKILTYMENFDLSFITENNKKINESKINTSRYDELISIFGEEVQKKIFDTSMFIVGANRM